MTALALSRRKERTLLALVTSGHFFSHGYFLVFPPLLPLMAKDLAVSYTALGTMLSIYALASGGFQTPVGVLVDKFGAKHFLIGGLALLSLSIFGMGFFASYAPFLVLAFLAGTADSVFHPADYSILNAGIHVDRLGRAFSTHTFAGYVGWAVTPLSMTFLTDLFSWQRALNIVGLLGFLVAVVLFLQRHRFEVHSPASSQKSHTSFSQNVALFLSPPFLLLLLFFCFTAMGGTGLSGFTPTVLPQLYSMDLAAANFALTLWLLGSMGGVLIGGYLADRFQRFDWIASVGILVGALILCLVAFQLFPASLVSAAYLVGGLVIGIIAPSRDLMVRAISPPDKMGQAFGFVSTGLGVGGAVAPIVFGLILDHGEPQNVLVISAAFLCLSLVAAVSVSRIRA